uniref:Uncharacterized protein n=1 Tax=Anguilla anguilla TaxID=7936 RepID=A0A0E9V5Q9_ANGAN
MRRNGFRMLQQNCRGVNWLVAEHLKPLSGVSKDSPCQIAKCRFRAFTIRRLGILQVAYSLITNH